MGRLIDEDDVLKALCRELCHPGVICPDGYCEEIRERLKDVPTAQPERTGYKINQHQYPAKWVCSECGAKHFNFDDIFCSRCGARVEDADDK